MAKRLLPIMNHDRHRFVPQLNHVTSPGLLYIGDSRHQAGLDASGASAVITDLANQRPYGPDSALHLASVHEGHSLSEVVERTSRDLQAIPGVGPTPRPTTMELAALHRIGRDGFWRR